MKEDPRLDRYLRAIQHTCNGYCVPPVHYSLLAKYPYRGPRIIPGLSPVEAWILYMLCTIIVIAVLFVGMWFAHIR